MADPAECAYDMPMRPDQYRHLVTRSWSLETVSTHLRYWAAMRETISEEWIPADPRREWVLRVRPTGRRNWLRGSCRSAFENGYGDSFIDEPPAEHRACAGRYFTTGETRDPTGQGSWQLPTPMFLDALPRQPRLLLRRLAADDSTHASPTAHRLRSPESAGPLTHALDVLRGGLVPAELRAALYRALRLLPSVRIVADATNLDGSAAIAFVLDSAPVRYEMFVDSQCGHYIGERETVLARNRVFRVRPGTIIADTAVRTDTVDEITAPARSGHEGD